MKIDLGGLSEKTCCNRPKLVTLYDGEGLEKHWSILRCERCYCKWQALMENEWYDVETDGHDSSVDFRFSSKLRPLNAILTRSVKEDEIQRDAKLSGSELCWVVWQMDKGASLVKTHDIDQNASIEDVAETLLQSLQNKG